MITMPCCGHHGRLGNMMLQFAAGYAHAKRTGQEFLIPHSDYTQYLSNLPKWVKITDQIPTPPVHYEEPSFAYRPIPAGLRNASIRGYFQSYRHFEDCADDIWRIFAGDIRKTSAWASDELMDFGCFDRTSEAVAFCVRRTDYLQPDRIKFHGVLGDDYHREARKQFSDDKTFVVFSDDLDWCRENLRIPNVLYCDEKDHWKKLWLIAACEGGAIIANSTYHLWGAWFGWHLDQKRKIVWPKAWFGPSGPNAETDDICPKQWMRI